MHWVPVGRGGGNGRLLGTSSVMNLAVLELLLAVIADGRRLNGACI